MDNKKLTAHQCYIKSIADKLSKEQYKQLLKDNQVIIGLRTSFTDMLKNKYLEIDVDKAISIFNEKYGTIVSEKNIVMPLNCDLNKNLLISILNELIKDYRYDFSKNCKCESRIGETWCCNQCGLPTVKTSDNLIIENLNKCISEQLQYINSLQIMVEPLNNRIKILQNLNFKYREKLGISNEPVDALGLISPLDSSCSQAE